MTEPKAVSLREAAELCGVSLKAMRNRADRGTIPTIKRNGVRLVPLSALESTPVRQEVPQGASAEAGLDLSVLVDRLEELATENGRLAALESVSSSTEARLRDELAEARARAMSLELQLAEVQASNGSWFTRRKRRRDVAASEGATEAIRIQAAPRSD